MSLNRVCISALFLTPSINTGAAVIEVDATGPARLALVTNAMTITHKAANGSDLRTTVISFQTAGSTPRLRMASFVR